jgi:ubiquinone biosynthesis protein
MKITSIPQFARNAGRATEVLSILSKYGLADWISRMNIRFIKGIFNWSSRTDLANLTTEARIRLAMTELGTTFIKLGQVLSTRADLVGPALAAELSKLQAHVRADSVETVRATILEELGKPGDGAPRKPGSNTDALGRVTALGDRRAEPVQLRERPPLAIRDE